MHSTNLVAALALAITITIAAISWHFFESPILKLREKREVFREPLPAKVEVLLEP